MDVVTRKGRIDRLELAKFEAGFFQQFVDVNRRFAGLLSRCWPPMT
jgi:hypothetical protein